MRTRPIIVLDESRERRRPLGLGRVRAGVLPLLGDRPVHALDLAVLPGAERPRVDVPRAGRLQKPVELAAAVAGPVVRHHALDPHAHALEEAQAPAHERRAGALALVGQQLGVGDPAEVVDGHVQAGRPRAPRGAAAAPQGAVPAAVGYAGHLLDIDVHELAGPLALVADGGDRAPPPGLAGDAVDVGEPEHPAPRHDSGARPRRHARDGRQPERGEQHRRARLSDAVLDLTRRGPRQPARAAAAVGHGLAGPAAAQPLARRLAADAHLPGGLGDRDAGLYPGDKGLPPPRGEPCVRMLDHGRAPLLFV